jgi:hypothetical protein
MVFLGEEYEISIPTIPIYVLPLATIKVQPGVNPKIFSVSQYGINRVPVSELQNIRKRLNNVEFNLALDSLENEAQNIHLGRDRSAVLYEEYLLMDLLVLVE